MIAVNAWGMYAGPPVPVQLSQLLKTWDDMSESGHPLDWSSRASVLEDLTAWLSMDPPTPGAAAQLTTHILALSALLLDMLSHKHAKVLQVRLAHTRCH